MSDDGILKFSNAGGVTSLTRYPNFLTNYGDFGALQRIGYQSASATTGTFTFSNIPSTFQDLMLVAYTRDVSTGTSPYISALGIRLNGDTGSNYSDVYTYGNGSTASVSSAANETMTISGQQVMAGAGANIFSAHILHFLNYANSVAYKTILTRSASDSNGQGWSWLCSSTWRNTSPVTSILLSGGAGGFAAGSTFELFGIKASAA